MNKISTIGLDLAKNVFQVHGIDGDGRVVVTRQLRRAGSGVFRQVEPVPCGPGGVRDLASLGP